MHEAASRTSQGILDRFGGCSMLLGESITSYRLEGGIPKEKWFEKKVEFNHLRVFECTAYMHVAAGERSKLDARSKKMVFLGYPRGVKGYRL